MADQDCACGCLAVKLARVCGLSLQPTCCTSAIACDVQCYCSCSCCLWRYISVTRLPLPLQYLLILLTTTSAHGPWGCYTCELESYAYKAWTEAINNTVI